MTPHRKPRMIDFLSGGPDQRTTDINNALYVIIEFVSPRRLSTLATRPSPAQLLAAVDLYLKWEGAPSKVEPAHALRLAAELWREHDEVPASVHASAKQLMAALMPEPPGGWHAHDGYHRDELGGHDAAGPCAIGTENAMDPSPLAEASQRAASLAQAWMHGLNLVALLASPRLIERAAALPSQAHILLHLDEMNALSPESDPTRAAVERLRTECAQWTPRAPAPLEIVDAARALLAQMGVGEPPGGWDAFEGVAEPQEEKGE